MKHHPGPPWRMDNVNDVENREKMEARSGVEPD